ncbi:MAG: DsbA family protein [Pyrinomonadaceae bacterium]
MKFLSAFGCLLLLVLSGFAQDNSNVLALANGKTFTLDDISYTLADQYRNFPKELQAYRVPLIEHQIEGIDLELEAASRNISVDQLLQEEIYKKVPDPTEKEVKALYEANKNDLIDIPYSEIKKRIVAYLRIEPERARSSEFLKSLAEKYPAKLLMDIRLPNLKPGDKVLQVGPRTVTYGEFLKANGLALYEFEANVYDKIYAAVKQVVDANIYAAEANSLGISTSDLIAREITSKMSGFNDAEYARLQSDLERRLYKKYRVSYLVKEPEPFVQSISTDDDPSTGPANAPITVVMFSDFQCPACSGAYPVLKKVMDEYPGKIRFVVRDFPLVNMHENAFMAAIAADAANAQGKFFEYTQKLYANQGELDEASLIKYAGEVGLDVKKFEKDLKNPVFVAEVEKDIADGEKYGVGSTPTIFVNGIKVRSLSEESFRSALNRFAKLLD